MQPVISWGLKFDLNQRTSLFMSIYQTALTDRRLLQIGGPDRVDFLQNLVTQDVAGPPTGSCVMAALLTPQGKLLYDFIIYIEEQRFLLDVDATIADALLKKLTMYKLRADVTVADSPASIYALWQEDGFACPPTAGFYQDPRHEGLGLRGFFDTLPDINLPTKALADWHDNRVKLGVAEGPVDMPPGSVFPLEYGFAQAHAIDFKKGCFVGQEVTSRTYRKGALRKKLHAIALSEAVGAPDDAMMAGDRIGGTLVTRRGHFGLALIREDAVNETLLLQGASITVNGGLFADDSE